MKDWAPRDQLSSFEYLLFLVGIWVQVDRVPEWVTAAHCRWYQAHTAEHDRSYFGAKEFRGDEVTYRIDHIPQGTKCQEDLRYYVKVSWRDSISNHGTAGARHGDSPVERLA